MAENKSSLTDILGALETLELTDVNGRITEVVGMLIRAVVPNVKIGEVRPILASSGVTALPKSLFKIAVNQS